MEFRRDVLHHTDDISPYLSMNKTVRNNSALYISAEQHIDISWLRFAENLSLTGAARYDWSKTRKDSTSYRDTVTSNSVKNWSPKVGAAISKGSDFTYTIRASYGKSFRLPSLNALFWKGDVRTSGNPGLKPERSEHSEAGLELKGRLVFAEIAGGMTYFHSAISDLIIWLPLYGGWKPVNRNRAQITGHEDFIDIGLFDGLLELQYKNSVTTPLNKSQPHTVYNKQLVFSPHYVTTYSLKFDTRYFYGSYSIRLCDRVYILEANTKYYPAYRIDDLQLGAKYNIKTNWQIRTDLKIYNIRDIDYILLTHYPMPGREWHFQLSITYGLGDT
jgi:outer membrane cobalamin receptor